MKELATKYGVSSEWVREIVLGKGYTNKRDYSFRAVHHAEALKLLEDRGRLGGQSPIVILGPSPTPATLVLAVIMDDLLSGKISPKQANSAAALSLVMLRTMQADKAYPPTHQTYALKGVSQNDPAPDANIGEPDEL